MWFRSIIATTKKAETGRSKIHGPPGLHSVNLRPVYTILYDPVHHPPKNFALLLLCVMCRKCRVELILSIFLSNSVRQACSARTFILCQLAILPCPVRNLKKHSIKTLYKHLFICYVQGLLVFILLACNSSTWESELRAKVVTGKMFQWLRVLVAFSEEHRSIPNIYVVVDKSIDPVPRDPNGLFWFLHEQILAWYTSINASKTLTSTIKYTNQGLSMVALRRQGQVSLCVFEASLVYRVSLRTTRIIQRNPVSKKRKERKQQQKD